MKKLLAAAAVVTAGCAGFVAGWWCHIKFEKECEKNKKDIDDGLFDEDDEYSDREFVTICKELYGGEESCSGCDLAGTCDKVHGEESND